MTDETIHQDGRFIACVDGCAAWNAGVADGPRAGAGAGTATGGTGLAGGKSAAAKAVSGRGGRQEDRRGRYLVGVHAGNPAVAGDTVERVFIGPGGAGQGGARGA